MKKLLFAIICMLPLLAFSQIRTEIATGKYYIMTLGNSDYVRQADRPTVVSGPTGLLQSDTVFYVPASASNSTISTLMAAANNLGWVSILQERGTVRDTTITVSNDSIIFATYGSGAKPKIYGSKVITGWTLHSGNIYKASVTTPVTQLFYDGVKMQVARMSDFSETLYAYTTIADTMKPVPWNATYRKTRVKLTGINLPPDSLEGATAITRTYNWQSQTKQVISSNVDTITLDAASDGLFNPGQGILLLNKLSFLNAPGEWFCDSANNVVYFFTPDGTSPSDNEVRVSTLDNGIVIDNKDYITIKNLDIRHQKLNGIKIMGDSPNNITISNSNFTGQDNIGIFSEAVTSAKNYLINNNTISDIAGYGMWLFRVADCVITDNTITDIGLFRTWGIANTGKSYLPGNQGTGIHIVQDGVVGRNTLEYNFIYNTGYNGIYWSGDADIRYNYVYANGLSKADGGGIYTAAAVSNSSVVSYNIVDYSVGRKEGQLNPYNEAFGIYLDEGSQGVEVLNNTVLNHSRLGIYLHRGIGHTVRYNKVFNNDIQIYLSGGNSTRNYIDNNLMVTGPSTNEYYPNRQLLSGTNVSYAQEAVVATIENNKIIHPYNSLTNGDLTFNDRIRKRLAVAYTWTANVITITAATHRYRAGDAITISSSTGSPTINGDYTVASVTNADVFTISKSGSGTTGTCTLNASVELYYTLARYRDRAGYETGSTKDSTALLTGETQRLVYNNSKTTRTFYLNSATALKDSLGSTISLNFSLAPFRSKYVRGLNTDCILPYSDAVAPTMTAFSIPATVTGLDFNINTFTTSADATGYIITESETVPALTASGWSTTIPATYTLSSSGVKPVFAWCRDAAGNVSTSFTDTITASYNTSTLSTGLIAAYDFDETSGYLLDVSGNALHAISNDGTNDDNVAINQTGAPGMSYTFNGTAYNNGRVRVADNNLLTFTSAMSIFIWLPELTTIDKNHALIYKGGTDEYRIIITNGNKIQFQIYNGTGQTIQVTGSTVLQAGTRYFIECSSANVLNRSDMKININNQPETLTNGATTSLLSVLNGSGRLQIGGEEANGYYLNGKISQVLMYGRLLTVSEKQALYNDSLGINKANW
jgi:parallel beta-helix repeat protein